MRNEIMNGFRLVPFISPKTNSPLPEKKAGFSPKPVEIAPEMASEEVSGSQRRSPHKNRKGILK